MIYTVILTTDTSIYASGDLLADTQLVGVIGRGGKVPYLDSVRLIDQDDQGIALDLLFLNANTSLGTENGAPNISDADVLANVIGALGIVAGDYIDMGGSRIAEKANLNIPFYVVPAGSLYVGAITRGTPTYTATGLQLQLGINYR